MNLHNFAVSFTLPVPVPYQPELAQLVPFNVVVTHYTESQVLEQVNAGFPRAKDLKITDMGEIVRPPDKEWTVHCYVCIPVSYEQVWRVYTGPAGDKDEAVARAQEFFRKNGFSKFQLLQVDEGKYDPTNQPKF